ncbi:hypothetical protein HZS_4202 [Henneguya salminicola]|nr:hypothetical protein HZS_4202 [Henneguya salminicola]
MMSSEYLVEREYLYRSIIGQFLYDGLHNAAKFIGNTVGIEVNKIPPSPQLLYATRSYRKTSKTKNHKDAEGNEIELLLDETTKQSAALDFDSIFDCILLKLCIKQFLHHHYWIIRLNIILEVERILLRTTELKPEKSSKSAPDEIVSPKNHPVVKTLYDHTSTVSCLEFHPSGTILSSGGMDKNIHLFDFTKSSIKKAFKTINEVEVINSLSFHPSGDFLLVAVEHPTIRLYDLNTLNCYVTSQLNNIHTSSVNYVKYDSTGRMYVSASDDGSFKIISACFSASGKYILSASIDGAVRLWDIRTGQPIQSYLNATQTNPGLSPALFNQNDDYIIYLDDKCSHGCWNSRTGEKICSTPILSNSIIRWTAHSPCEPALVSCCEDTRIRFIHFGN